MENNLSSNKQNEIQIGKIIEAELHRQERTVSWLARHLNCDRSNVYKIFQKSSMDTQLLARISKLLDCNFFEYYWTED